MQSDQSDTGETIYAVATGAGRSAIAIVRVSGPACGLILARLCPGVSCPDRVATHTAIYDTSGSRLDKGLIIRFCAPRSFTGEDMVEFQVTGSRAVLSGLLRALAVIPGTRAAEAGEFARRAFLNGKRDLAEVEGLASLVEAETAAQLRQALQMANGEISRKCERIREHLLRSLSLMESLLDFSDVEDASDVSVDQIIASVGSSLAAVEQLLAHEEMGTRLRDGMTIVIAGPPNVGKSTLMNALARRDVAIVSETPGTTRDALEFSAEIAGYPITFVDTAGLRETTDPIEAEGIARARRRSDSADVTLWLTSEFDTCDAVEPPNGLLLPVRTKLDLAASSPRRQGEVAISALTGEGLKDLMARIAGIARDHFAGVGAAVLGTDRQRAAARDAAAALRRILQNPDMAAEIMAEDLRLATAAMARVTGRIEVEEVLGDIFSRLCVGK